MRRHLQKTLTLTPKFIMMYDFEYCMRNMKPFLKCENSFKSLLHLVNIVQKQWKRNLYFVAHCCSVPSAQMKFNTAKKITKNWPRSIQPVLTTTNTVIIGPWKESAFPIPSPCWQLAKSHATSVWHPKTLELAETEGEIKTYVELQSFFFKVDHASAFSRLIRADNEHTISRKFS